MPRSWMISGLALAALLAAAPPAGATFPGANGKIAWSQADGIYVIEPDGTGRVRLGFGRNPAWSADGTRIAFYTTGSDPGGAGIHVMNADGSGRHRIAANGTDPAWSPDGRIVFSRFTDEDSGLDLYVMNADGSGLRRLTSGPHDDDQPSWSPDGARIAFTAHKEDSDIHLVDADGSGRVHRTTNAAPDLCPSWSPDGTRIAHAGFPDDATSLLDVSVFLMAANSASRTLLVRPGGCSAISPDGRRIAFNHAQRLEVMDLDGSGRTPLPSLTTGADDNVDWQPLPCRDGIRVGHAVAQGCFSETAPGSGVFETDEAAWVGGFEIRPRPDGKLVLDTGVAAVRAQGAGVDVLFAEYPVPLPVEALPVGLAEADVQLGGAGSATMLLDLPLKTVAKVRWDDGGTAARFEGEISVSDLAGPVGRLVQLQQGEAVGETTAKLTAGLRNGTGFVLDQAEVAIAKIDVIPTALRVPKVLQLRNLLLRFERREGRPFWTGRAGIVLPFGGRDLTITGTVYIFDGVPSGGGAEVDDINRLIPETPLFLQRVAGDLLFAPAFGFDLRIGASLGPRIGGAELLGLEGTVKGGTLATGCRRGSDPAQFAVAVTFKPLDELERLNLARAALTGTACLYTGPARALELSQGGTIEWLGGLFAVTGSHSGYVSRTGASLGGDVTFNLPTLPDLAGRVLISNRGIAACGTLSFAQAGFGYRWGRRAPDVFRGCDLGPFDAPAAAAAGAPAATRTVRMPRGLPHAALRITSAAGAPRVRVSGPGGFRAASPAGGGALRTRDAVIVPVAHEKATYVLVRRPRPGRWRIHGEALARVALARGLPQPRIKARVRRAGKRQRLTYTVRPLPSQRVTFHERGRGVARALGRARGRRGRIAFTPASAPARERTIVAEVTQNGLPRARLTVARYRAAAPKRPGRPRIKARRTAATLRLDWPRVAGASAYLVTVRQGAATLHDVVTRRRRVKLAAPATGRLEVTVQALSDSTRPGRPAKRMVRAP